MAYKLIEAGRSKDIILQITVLYVMINERLQGTIF